MKKILIVTHPGRPHKDDFLACALLLYHYRDCNITIVRRDPEVVDLTNPDVFVVDVGGKYEPAYNNYDHHQFPPGGTPKCAISLVLEHLGIYEAAKAHCGWLEVAEVLDCQGPKKTAEYLGIAQEAFMRTLSPVEEAVLKAFEGYALISWEGADNEHTAWIAEMMVKIGESIIVGLENIQTREKWLSENYQLQHLEGEYWALYIERPVGEFKDPALGMSKLRQRLQKEFPEREIVLSITPDDRNGGYSLYRYEDHPAVDFTLIPEQAPELDCLLGFIASTGFIAKTREPLPLVKLMELARASILPAMAEV